ncbi:MAG: DUF1211 domain-containing protein, partial [Verrucomicrobia bacterium]
MPWSDTQLSTLPRRGGFRLRGEAMTRIEVFSDAAFAFAVTMLVISLSAIPETFAELILAIKGVPAFTASFAIIMVLWVSHRRWSRRFGLDDGISTFLTLALILVILVYVYPLRIMMAVLFYSVSGGWLPANFQISDTAEVAGLVALFSVGFGLVALIQFGLYLRASARAEELRLDPLERVLVREEQVVWITQAIIASCAATAAIVFMGSWGYLAGILYSITPVAIPLATLRLRRKRRAL